jgi:hypothetical protein
VLDDNAGELIGPQEAQEFLTDDAVPLRLFDRRRAVVMQ